MLVAVGKTHNQECNANNEGPTSFSAAPVSCTTLNGAVDKEPNAFMTWLWLTLGVWARGRAFRGHLCGREQHCHWLSGAGVPPQL